MSGRIGHSAGWVGFLRRGTFGFMGLRFGRDSVCDSYGAGLLDWSEGRVAAGESSGFAGNCRLHRCGGDSWGGARTGVGKWIHNVGGIAMITAFVALILLPAWVLWQHRSGQPEMHEMQFGLTLPPFNCARWLCLGRCL